jgi:hypothetical protein
MFPFGVVINSWLIAAVFVWIGIAMWRSQERALLTCLAVMVAINALGFIATRPGVTTLFLRDKSSAEAIIFFYAGTMLFIFGAMYSLRHWFKRLSTLRQIAFATAVIIYFFLAFPLAGKSADSYAYYKPLATLPEAVSVACASKDKVLHITVYPGYDQVVVLPRKYICSSDS